MIPLYIRWLASMGVYLPDQSVVAASSDHLRRVDKCQSLIVKQLPKEWKSILVMIRLRIGYNFPETFQ